MLTATCFLLFSYTGNGIISGSDIFLIKLLQMGEGSICLIREIIHCKHSKICTITPKKNIYLMTRQLAIVFFFFYRKWLKSSAEHIFNKTIVYSFLQ